jgi:hypothetical protein
MSAASYQDILEKVVLDMPRTHPTTARYPAIASALAHEIAYKEWRRHRVFDHMVIFPGAQMPDGEMGYSVNFYESRPSSNTSESSHRTIRLSTEELLELKAKIEELNL